MSKTKTNTITATLTADKNLPSHLFLVKILDSKGSDAAVHYQPKKALTKGSSETISFNFKPDSTGNHTIKAYAWTKWVSQKGQSLGNNYKATGNYEIK